MIVVSSMLKVVYRYKGYNITYCQSDKTFTINVTRRGESLLFTNSKTLGVSLFHNNTDRIIYLSTLIDNLINVNFNLQYLWIN